MVEQFVLPVVTFLISKTGEGALSTLGEKLTGYLFKHHPTFGKQLEEAKQEPAKADVQELARKLENKAEDNQELTEMISVLGEALKKQGSSIDTRRVILGDDYSVNQIHSGSGDNVGNKYVFQGEGKVKKNGY